MSVILSGTFIVEKIKKKTTAKFFKDLKEGDKFELRYSLNGMYSSQAPSINIYVNDELKHYNNAAQLKSNLDKFELKKVGY